MDIPSPSFFGAVSSSVAIMTAIGTYYAFRVKKAQVAAELLTVMRAEIATKLDRKEHTEICDKANKHIQDKLDLIVGMINGHGHEMVAVREMVSETQKATAVLVGQVSMLTSQK